VKDTVHLIANSKGIVRMTKGIPSLRRDEIAVAVRVTIPADCFRSPLLTVNIDVPSDRIIIPTIEAEVLEKQVQS
jgi:hypothetical protein